MHDAAAGETRGPGPPPRAAALAACCDVCGALRAEGAVVAVERGDGIAPTDASRRAVRKPGACDVS